MQTHRGLCLCSVWFSRWVYVAAVRKALEGRPSRAEYWAEYFMVGKQFEDLGQVDRAMAIYRAVAGARPQHAEARDRLLRLSQ